MIALNVDDTARPPPLTSRSVPLSQDPVAVTTWYLSYQYGGGHIEKSIVDSDLLYYEHLVKDRALRKVLGMTLAERSDGTYIKASAWLGEQC